MIDRYVLPDMARIWSEEHKLERWLQVEVAVCDAWAEEGVIPREDAERIRRHARYDLEAAHRYEAETRHDVTAFLRSVADSLGPEGRWVHLGLTSYDVVDTALSLLLVEAAEILAQDLAGLRAVLAEQALRYKDTLMIGRTHGVHAEPITFGLKLALWLDEVQRQQQRLAAAQEGIAVGKISGAVGTHATVPPSVEEAALAALGLRPAPVSSQILQRDRHAHYVGTLALVAASLEKFATEVRHLQRTEVLEAEEPFAPGQTGSSAMPHKRNPEKSERICGLARVVRGHALAALENVALWHERDISNSAPERIILPEACHLVHYMLRLFTDIMAGLQVYPQRMRQNLELTQGLVFSQRVLLALIERGMGREEAYKLVQGHAMRAWGEGRPFLELLAQDAQVAERLPREELAALFDYGYYTRYVDDAFRRLRLLA